MPNLAAKACLDCGKATDGGPRCAAHQVRRDAEYAQDRRDDPNRRNSTERGYGYRWQQERAAYLEAHPVCVHCKAEKRLTPATIVDHIIPHKGDMRLFWDKSNWQSLCETHHNRKTARESGFARRGRGH